jgi:hypothetical protein
MALPVFEKFQKTMAEMKIQWDITSDTEMPVSGYKPSVKLGIKIF